jgi:enamine deaminase RidA (YjgF/YER057c/UK114 family)
MARLGELLIKKLEGFLGQLYLSGIPSNIETIINYLVNAEDVDIQDLRSVISLIVEALKLEAKEVEETDGDLQEAAEASYANIAGVLKKQLELVAARIKELETVLDSVANISLIIPVEPKQGTGIIVSVTSPDKITFPD